MLLSIVLLLGSFFLINRLQAKNFAIFNSVASEKMQTIKDTLPKTEELGFTALMCNEIRVPFDEASNTFFVPLDMDTKDWETLKFTSGQAGFQLFFTEDITDEDKSKVISEGRKVNLIVSTAQNWSEYYVTFTGLPVIDLSTNEGFYAAEEITGTAVFYDTDFVIHGTAQSEYNGHIRGNTSRMFPKKGYKLNLVKHTASDTIVNNKQSIFGMREDDDWILYAMYNDESKIRDRLCIDIWNAFGAKAVSEKSTYGTNLTYVEVIADDSYCGLYGLMEPVDAKQLNLNSEDYLYKRKNPSDLGYEEFLNADNPYEMVHGFEIKEGEMNEKAWQPMAELSYLVHHTSDEEYIKNVGNYIDVDSAMRMWLFMQIITGHDQRAKNVFYAARYEGENYKFCFAPWDMDLTWGNVSVGEVNPLYTDFEWETYDDNIPWETADRLIDLNVNGTADKMQELYTQLRKTILSDEQLKERISQLDHQLRISGAYERDCERWPEAAHTDDYQKILYYARLRLRFLDQALFDLEKYN